MATKEQVHLALAIVEGRQEPKPGQGAIMTIVCGCDVCNSPRAIVDGKTKSGLWANMCTACFSEYGVGIGTGLGQVLIWKPDV
jgi:hypothetical protein